MYHHEVHEVHMVFSVWTERITFWTGSKALKDAKGLIKVSRWLIIPLRPAISSGKTWHSEGISALHANDEKTFFLIGRFDENVQISLWDVESSRCMFHFVAPNESGILLPNEMVCHDNTKSGGGGVLHRVPKGTFFPGSGVFKGFLDFVYPHTRWKN